MKQIFNLKKYFEWFMMQYGVEETRPGWYSDCDGKEVINNYIDIYYIADEWCDYVV